MSDLHPLDEGIPAEEAEYLADQHLNQIQIETLDELENLLKTLAFARAKVRRNSIIKTIVSEIQMVSAEYPAFTNEEPF